MFYPQHYDDAATATCDNCSHECPASECGPIKDPGKRLCSGDPLPAGECPECGSLAYVPARFIRKQDNPELDTIVDGAWQWRDELYNEIIPDCATGGEDAESYEQQAKDLDKSLEVFAK